MNKSLISTQAYRIFLVELEQHVSRIETSLLTGVAPTQDALRLASASFHTIKGGAGFFGYDKLAKLAGDLESGLLKPISWDKDGKRVLKAVHEFSAEARQICSQGNLELGMNKSD